MKETFQNLNAEGFFCYKLFKDFSQYNHMISQILTLRDNLWHINLYFSSFFQTKSAVKFSVFLFFISFFFNNICKLIINIKSL
jgi:hypothetical protein